MISYREARKPLGSLQYLFESSSQSREGAGLMTAAHFHEHFELLYCEAGLCELRLGERAWRFGAGDMVLIDPMEAHQVTALGEGEHRYIVVKFAPEMLYASERPAYEMRVLLSYMRPGARHRKLYAAPALESSFVPALVKELYREYTERAYGYELAIRSGITRLFVWILRQWRAPGEAWREDEPDEEAFGLLQRAFAYIEARYAQEITLLDAARHCGMSYTAFSRFFARYARHGFAEYLTLVRLQKAALLLATTARSVTDVAMETGFSSTSYFIRRFRARHGVTPGQFRRRFGAPPSQARQSGV